MLKLRKREFLDNRAAAGRWKNVQSALEKCLA